VKRAASGRVFALLRLGAAALVIVLLFRLLGDLDWGRVGGALSRTQAGLVVLAALLNLTANTLVRVARRAALLKPLPHGGQGVGFGELAGLVFTNFAGNSLLPARAGDALFVAQLNRRHGYPVGTLVAVQLVEKVVEATSLWACAWPVACLLAMPLALRLPLYAFLGTGAVALPLLALAASRAQGAAKSPAAGRSEVGGPSLRARLARQWERLGEALRLMHTPRVWSRAVLWSCASAGLDAAMIGLCLAAVGIRVPVAAWLLVLLAVNFAILVPATPGQVGILEAGAVIALRLINVGGSEALVFALLYHAAHIVPMSLAGAVVLAVGRPART